MATTTQETHALPTEVTERHVAETTNSETVPRLIACTFFTGVVAYDAKLDYRQQQPFANWAHSDLSWNSTFIEQWPDDEPIATRAVAAGRPAVSATVASPAVGQPTAQEATALPMPVRESQS